MKKEGVVLIASEESTGRAESYPAATSATDCMEHCDDESSTNEVSSCRVCSLKRLKPSVNQVKCHKTSKVFLHIARHINKPSACLLSPLSTRVRACRASKGGLSACMDVFNLSCQLLITHITCLLFTSARGGEISVCCNSPRFKCISLVQCYGLIHEGRIQIVYVVVPP